MIDPEKMMKDLLTPDMHAEVWKGVIYSDEGLVFLRAAATQFGHMLSDGQVVDETGRPAEGLELKQPLKRESQQKEFKKLLPLKQVI